MAYANGRIPTSELAALPTSWSNKGEQEYLDRAAYESLSRMMARAAADTGVVFRIYDAYRSLDEQVEMLKRYYTPVNRGKKYNTDRSYGGKVWAKKAGSPVAASPGYSNHGVGKSVDIHPAEIQAWLRSNAAKFGWVNDVPTESWHWTYAKPENDRFKSEGLVDFAAIQRALGITADGLIGPGTVQAVKNFQASHGLEADGKIGPATKGAILGNAPASAPVPAQATAPSINAMSYDLDTSRTSVNVNKERFGHSVKHITIHYWGKWVGQKHEAIVDYLCRERSNGTSAHYVLSPGHVSRIVPEEWTAWANGNREANRDSITIELNPDPARLEETIATAGALVRDIRSRWGDLPLVPHKQWKNTDCPGPFTTRLGDIDAVARGGAIGGPRPASSGLAEDGKWGRATSTEIQKRLGVSADGIMGNASWSALQRVFGTPADGVISGQRRKASDLGNGISGNSWRFVSNGGGSSVIVALQKSVGAKVDGLLGPDTIAKLQHKLNTDSNFLRQAASTPAPTKKLAEDGKWGQETSKEVQRRLGVTADGRMGPDSWTRMQKWLKTPADGVISGQRHRASELGNGISDNGWKYSEKGNGSSMVKALQAYCGVRVDGQLFSATTLQMQKMINAYPVFLTDGDAGIRDKRIKDAGL